MVADAQAQGCTALVNLGDSLSGPLWPAETADYLIARDWPTVAGNHERQLRERTPQPMYASDAFTLERLTDAHRAWIAAQPAVLHWSPELFLCHGSPDDDLCFLLEDLTDRGMRLAAPETVAQRLGDRPERLTLCGHSHRPAVLPLGDGRIVANPGSVGLQAYAETAQVRTQTGSPDARYAIVEQDEITLRIVAYDHARAAYKAEREGFAGWAAALRTGCYAA